MIENVNDTKKHYFVWIIVTSAIFCGLFFGIMYLTNSFGGDDETVVIFGKEISGNLLGVLFFYAISTLPLGFYLRRKVMRWYVHVPTEDIQIFESNLILALFRLIKCEVLAVFNLALLCFYMAVSVLFGIFMFPYHVISGIVFMIKRTI